ncbi:MAG: MFS transporter [Gammaproteobacteria bacterium]|nr:MFS transporter [Gammaproteobacteria bacterium]
MQPALSYKKIFFMVFIGSALEAYDYALYGYFAPILAQLFFPSLDRISALLTSFTIFAAGFITRPIGALIIGYYGDKYGRKKTLMLSIMLMALPTTLIGLLPTYSHIGIYAGIALALCRLLQGFSVGAEFVGTMIYVIEQAPAKRQSLLGSLCTCSGYVGMLCTTSLFFLLTHFISEKHLYTFGWRIPFLAGIILGLIGFYLRANLAETRAFKQIQENKAIAVNPLLETIKEMPHSILLGISVVMVPVLGFYFLFVYMPSHLTLYYKISAETVSLVNMLVLAISSIAIPFIGSYAENKEKKYFIMTSALSIFIFSYPLMYLIQQGNLLSLLIAQGLLSILVCLASAIVPIYLVELFPVSLRYTGVSICYNFSAVLFGGTAPLIATYLIKNTHQLSAPGFYLMLAAGISFVCVLLLKNNTTMIEAEASL